MKKNMEDNNNKNMELYNQFRAVPDDAVKPIQAGRLKGKSDINPMWRLKRLTEVFGPCGFGWKYEIVQKWLEAGEKEVSAFVQINLYVKYNGKWSEAIPGLGGASFIEMQRNGAYQSDECYKMALTDAISVACKALGVAADIYYANDKTKYTKETAGEAAKVQNKPRKEFPPQMVNDQNVMAWIYKKCQQAKNAGQSFSIANLLNATYVVTADDISKVSFNYENYIISNNLPQ